MTAIERAVQAAGSQTALAKVLGVTPQAVSAWVEQGFTPPYRVIGVAAATGVLAEDLFKDLLARSAGVETEGGSTD